MEKVTCKDCGFKGTEFDECGDRMFFGLETFTTSFVPDGGEVFRCFVCEEAKEEEE